MALTLVATVGAADANSYATVAEGNAFHEAHLYASVWNASTDEQKAQALIWATRILETHVDWDGDKASSSQALRWPRVGVRDADDICIASNVIPTQVKNATAELARALLTTDPNAQAASLAAGALKSLKVGAIAIEYAEGATTTALPLIPEQAAAMIQAFGVVRGMGFGTLERV